MLRPGDMFAGYTVERVIGRGGMGTVYAARHPRLPRLTALKLLTSAGDAEHRARFEREAELAGRLDHPNLVAIYDRGAVGAQLWISMQYVAGTDAAAALARGEMPPERAVHVVRETAKGLDYAHSFGLLHRDVKPANILIAAPFGPGERVLLSDFGIAKASDDSVRTGTGPMPATLSYASPEQLEGRALDPRSDVYSLACTLFELLTGAPPYAGDTAASVLHGHLFRPIPTITALRPQLPAQLDAVFAAGLAKQPADRFARCRDLAEAAAHALGMPAEAVPIPAARRSRRPLLLTAAAIGVAAAVAIPAVAFVATRDDTAAPPPPPPQTTSTVPPTGAGQGYERARPAVDLFPNLLPGNENGKGFRDAGCSIFHGEAPDAVSDFVYTVTCLDRDNLEFKVIAFDDAAAVRRALDTLPNAPSTDTTSRYGVAMALRRFVADGVNWVSLQILDAPRTSYLIEAAWPGHTHDEIVDNWVRVAPF